MTQDPTRKGVNVQFYAFNGQGQRINSIDLDGGGQKAIPQVCLNCHGGTYSTATKIVSRSTFLALDPTLLGTRTGSSYSQVNTAIGATPLSASPTKDWDNNNADKTFYKEVYHPYCSSCHEAQKDSGGFQLTTPADFVKHKASILSAIDSGAMPHAKVTFNRFSQNGGVKKTRNYLGNCAELCRGYAPGYCGLRHPLCK